MKYRYFLLRKNLIFLISNHFIIILYKCKYNNAIQISTLPQQIIIHAKTNSSPYSETTLPALSAVYARHCLSQRKKQEKIQYNIPFRYVSPMSNRGRSNAKKETVLFGFLHRATVSNIYLLSKNYD